MIRSQLVTTKQEGRLAVLDMQMLRLIERQDDNSFCRNFCRAVVEGDQTAFDLAIGAMDCFAPLTKQEHLSQTLKDNVAWILGSAISEALKGIGTRLTDLGISRLFLVARAAILILEIRGMMPPSQAIREQVDWFQVLTEDYGEALCFQNIDSAARVVSILGAVDRILGGQDPSEVNRREITENLCATISLVHRDMRDTFGLAVGHDVFSEDDLPQHLLLVVVLMLTTALKSDGLIFYR